MGSEANVQGLIEISEFYAGGTLGLHRHVGLQDLTPESSRKALYMPGMVAMRHNPLVLDMAQRLKARGMAPKAIIAAAMHKLVHLIYGVLERRKPIDVNWAKAAVETVALVVKPPKNSVRALDIQDGI